MSKTSSGGAMTRMSTRSSARLSQLPSRNDKSKDEAPPRSRTKRQVVKPQIYFSDDSEDECVNMMKSKPVLSTPKKDKSRTAGYNLNDISPVTPPKQKKTTHKNQPGETQKSEVKEDVTRTPSRLLVKLNLTSPLKNGEENRVGVSNRKQLFNENDKLKSGLSDAVDNENLPALKQKQSEKALKTDPSIYQSARRALHSSFPTEMPGREKELDELRAFIKKHIENETSGSLYISGPPGTGKTASLNMILEEDNLLAELRKVYVNCTAIKSPTAIYSRIAKELDIKTSGKSEKEYLTKLETYLRRRHKTILLVLDEIDQLENKNQSILYTIFEWPSKPNSRLILVGIANALDLTDRTLPRLQARCELKPQLMHFAPYTKPQIVQIFTARLKAAGVLEVFSPVALQMLAGKVAAVSGDVRRALDIGRRVIELVDQNKKGDLLKPIENLAKDLVDKEQVSETKPKAVELTQVVNVLNSVYGTSQNLTDENEDFFPLQQKIIVCSLLLILKKARNKDVTIGRLHEVYRRVCTKRNLLSVDQAEFVGLCSLIETRGILRVSGKKEARLNKVNLQWDEEEVAAALKDKQLMSMILQDDSSLGNL